MGWVNKLVRKIRDCPGILTAKDKLVDYSEMHSLLLGVIPYLLAYRLDMLFIRKLLVLLGMGVLIGFKAIEEKLREQYNIAGMKVNKDISKEPHYFFAGIFIAELFIVLGVV